MRQLLDDELPHTKEELHACLWDELSNVTSIRVFICELRREYNAEGHDIILERSSLGVRYRLAKGHLLG